jgi:hypothetical protein
MRQSFRKYFLEAAMVCASFVIVPAAMAQPAGNTAR